MLWIVSQLHQLHQCTADPLRRRWSMRCRSWQRMFLRQWWTSRGQRQRPFARYYRCWRPDDTSWELATIQKLEDLHDFGHGVSRHMRPISECRGSLSCRGPLLVYSCRSCPRLHVLSQTLVNGFLCNGQKKISDCDIIAVWRKFVSFMIQFL